jgi:hypothetical protein
VGMLGFEVELLVCCVIVFCFFPYPLLSWALCCDLLFPPCAFCTFLAVIMCLLVIPFPILFGLL